MARLTEKQRFKGITRVAQMEVNKNFKGPEFLPDLIERSVQCLTCVKAGMVCESETPAGICIRCKYQHRTLAICNQFPDDPNTARQVRIAMVDVMVAIDAYECGLQKELQEDRMERLRTGVDNARVALFEVLPTRGRRPAASSSTAPAPTTSGNDDTSPSSTAADGSPAEGGSFLGPSAPTPRADGYGMTPNPARDMNLLGSFEAIQTAVRNRIEWLGLMSRGLPVKDQEDDVSDKICTELSDAYNLEFTEWKRRNAEDSR